jgi:hypothetical protein
MRHWRPSEKEKRHRCESFVVVRLVVMGVPLKKKRNNEVKMQQRERRDYAARMATDRRNSVENEPELSNTMIARGLTPVKDNLLVIRMDVAGLTQWGPSWPSERVYGRGGIRENCGNLWKSQRPKEVNSPDRVGIFDRQLKVESKDA